MLLGTPKLLWPVLTNRIPQLASFYHHCINEMHFLSLPGGRRSRYTQKDGGGRVSAPPLAASPLLPPRQLLPPSSLKIC